MAPKKKEAVVVEDPGAVARAYVNPTPAGQLKAMDEPIAPKYMPHQVEASWNAWWEANGYYEGSSDPEDKRPKFSICLPPPNVTGSLHLGHALTVAVQDLLARWKRMSGYNVLWIPGIDHAGIATQVVVEKKLKREQGLSRHDLGRDDFVKQVYHWKEQYGSRITSQLRRMGCSLDWSREVFTMDAPRAASVTAAFRQFHADGLIYRDVRLTNWCCQLRSGISDIEVDYEELDKPKRLAVPGHPKDKTYAFGRIWSFAYKVDGSDAEVVIATTRPETMLGDVAVAVHPDDPRYKQLHGRMLAHPFVDRKLRIITDATLVDMSFGTGAVKVTPAHDPSDFACGRRHGLQEITIFTDDGKMADGCGAFSGMMRFDARVAVLAELKARGLFRGEADNKMRLGVCSRTGDVIEPMLKPQWWVDCSGMAKRATDAVRSGELRILPKEHEKTWYGWLDNIRDWCVSRQLWWGHRIPAYFPAVNGVEVAVVVAGSLDEARDMVVEREGCAPGEVSLVQDEDVLDTWFSSGLFPFSCLGWPDTDAPDFKAWHPTTLLETGQDILFFWVARMVMCSLHLTNRLPFTEVYLHAMVRDKRGRKMSKSLGNVIDPLEVIDGVSLPDLLAKLDAGNIDAKELAMAKQMNEEEYPQGIPECGSDALRFGLLSHCGQGRDVNLDINRVVAYRNFGNKLWNATRFAFLYFDPAQQPGTNVAPQAPFRPAALPVSMRLVSHAESEPKVDLPMLADAWILSRLAKATKAVNQLLAAYEISLAAAALYDFWYRELCDVYLEAIKPVMFLDSSNVADAATKHTTQTVLHACLHYGLRLLHPFMPYVTEELFQRLAMLAGQPRTSIMVAPYPQPGALAVWDNAEAEAAMELVTRLAGSIRSIRSTYLKGPLEKHAPEVYIIARDVKTASLVRSQAETIGALARSSRTPSPGAIHLVAGNCQPPRGCATEILDSNLEVHVMLLGIIDLSREVARLQKEKAVVEGRIDKLKAKMDMPEYPTKCKPQQQEEDRAKVQAMEGEISSLNNAIAQFEAAS